MSNEEEKIQSLQSQLKVKQEDYDFQKSSIEVISKRLAKTIPNDSIHRFSPLVRHFIILVVDIDEMIADPLHIAC